MTDDGLARNAPGPIAWKIVDSLTCASCGEYRVNEIALAGMIISALDDQAAHFAPALAAQAAEIARLQEQLDVRHALAPASHVHSFSWGANSAWTNTEPPPDCTCECGMAYRDARAEGRG